MSMSMQTTQFPTRRRRTMMAMVLGTALAALGPSAAEAVPPRAVNDISRYCTACWRNARLPTDRWGDCTQEVFQRLLERVPLARWLDVFAPEGEEREEFLRAIDTVKKRVQRDRQRPVFVYADVPDRRAPHDQELRETRELLQQAVQQALSRRQQTIVQRTCEGWSVADIAGELGLSAARVSDEKYKAIHKLRAHFAAI
jgi:RNA polymerase sigma factor (sigma-70 family)